MKKKKKKKNAEHTDAVNARSKRYLTIPLKTQGKVSEILLKNFYEKKKKLNF